MSVLRIQYSTFRYLIFLFFSINFTTFIPVFHCETISGLRLHNGMMSSRKNIQKQCPDLRPRNGMMSPPKTPTIIPVSETFSATVWKLWGNTHHNSGVLNIQRNGMEALGSSGGALGELWGAQESSGGALRSSGGALRSSGGSLTKIKTKSHIHFEFLADPSLIKKNKIPIALLWRLLWYNILFYYIILLFYVVLHCIVFF